MIVVFKWPKLAEVQNRHTGSSHCHVGWTTGYMTLGRNRQALFRASGMKAVPEN
jgi:hypothetical protein